MIVINLDVMLAKRKVSVTELSERLGDYHGECFDFKTERPRGGKIGGVE